MAKSLPKSLLWSSLAFVSDAARSSVSVAQDVPTYGEQMLQIESRGGRGGAMRQHSGGDGGDDDHGLVERTLQQGPPLKTTPVTTPCVPKVVELDFENAEVSHNNLGGQGPDEGDEFLLIKGIGRVNDKPFDMKVVTGNDDYLAADSKKNGLSGKSGQINVMVEHHAELTFSFIDHDTGDPVTLPAFYISLFDIDSGDVAEEVFTVSGFEEINVPEDHEYAVVDDPGGGKTMTSTNPGELCDNPHDPAHLGVVKCKNKYVDQRKRSFSMLFKEKSSFDVTFTVPPIAGTEKARAKRPGTGRNMDFAGSSALVTECVKLRENTQKPTCSWKQSGENLPPGTLPPGAKEDCTNGDYHIWKGTTREPFTAPTYLADTYGADAFWTTDEDMNSADGVFPDACIAYVKFRKKGTCGQWCEGLGMTCAGGMDDAHFQVKPLNDWQEAEQFSPTMCTLYPNGHSRQTQSNNGCDQVWKTQICACK